MAKDNRVTFRRRHSYNTRSNRIRKFKTPGGKLSVHYVTKAAKPVACGDCGTALQGVSAVRAGRQLRWAPCSVATLAGAHALTRLYYLLLQIPRARPYEMKLISRSERTVNRAYGGSRCAVCTRQRIMRAFIIEEQKIVKKVLLEKMKSAKAQAAA